MRKIRTFAVLAFMAFLGLGVASCWNPINPNGGTGGGIGDTTIHHGGVGDTGINTHGGGIGDTGRGGIGDTGRGHNGGPGHGGPGTGGPGTGDTGIHRGGNGGPIGGGRDTTHVDTLINHRLNGGRF